MAQRLDHKRTAIAFALKGVVCPVCSGKVDRHLYGEIIPGTEGSVILDDGVRITACAEVEYMRCENGHKLAVETVTSLLQEAG